jgi:hypothetical protein
MTSPALPNWARELVTLLPACSHFLLSGNVGDQYFVAPGADAAARVLRPLPALLAEVLHAQGLPITILHDISTGAEAVPRDDASTARATSVLGSRPSDIAPVGSLTGLAQLVQRVSTSPVPVALIIRSASRLVRDVAQLSDDEFAFFRSVDSLARNCRPCDVLDPRPRAGRARLVRPGQRVPALDRAPAAPHR